MKYFFAKLEDRFDKNDVIQASEKMESLQISLEAQTGLPGQYA